MAERVQVRGSRRIVRAALALAAAAAATPGLALAADEPALPSMPTDLLGVGFSLVLVVAAIIIAGWLYVRMQGLRGGPSSAIRVLAAQSLGPKERIVLVQVGDKQIAVGMTQAQLSTLHVFDEPVVAPDAPAVGTRFTDRLRAALGNAGAAGAAK
jgi:flagellar protein FliO/FliZ